MSNHSKGFLQDKRHRREKVTNVQKCNHLPIVDSKVHETEGFPEGRARSIGERGLKTDVTLQTLS